MQQIADDSGIRRHVISEIAGEIGYSLSPGQRRIVLDEQWLREQYLVKRRPFPDIANECGISDMTVIRCANEYGIPSRSSGVASHPRSSPNSPPHCIATSVARSKAVSMVGNDFTASTRS
jgi:hypothetical protein